jgi:hypothetical protein
MFERPDNWSELSPLERRKARLDHWQNQPVEFVSPEAEANYKERIDRIRKAYDIEPADRIVADLSMGAFEYMLRRKGLIGKDMLYHPEKLHEPVMEFNLEFQPDTAVNAFAYPGSAMDLLGFNTYIWGGQKLPDAQTIQMVEGEYMTADEYQEFTADPTGFFLRKYIPRMFSELGGLSMLPNFPQVTESVDVITLSLPFGMPPVQEAMKKLMEAGQKTLEFLEATGKTGPALAANGFPGMPGGAFCKAPFDFLGDTLRGTKGILTDMFRRPDELLEACERYVPILIEAIVSAADRSGAAQVTYVLHKGADSFMSKEQFEKFYWPTWKEVMLGLYEEGITSYLFIEGSYNKRLEYLAEMPEKSLVCHFDQTDMRRAKEVLSDKFTIAGNVPASLMSTGTVDAVRAYCDGLVELYEDTPGYIMSFGCGFEWTTDEKIIAYRDSVRQ